MLILKNNKRWSLWTIICYHIINGDLFKYPIVPEKYGLSQNGAFITDSIFREYIKGMAYLGEEQFNVSSIAVESIL
jgi:hypothetical protein